MLGNAQPGNPAQGLKALGHRERGGDTFHLKLLRVAEYKIEVDRLENWDGL